MANDYISLLPNRDYVQSLPEPAPNWRWVVKMPILQGFNPSVNAANGLGFSTGNNIGNNLFGIDSNSSQLFSSSAIQFGIVDQIDFQTVSIDSDQRFQAGTKTKYPRFMSMADVSISFFEDVKYTTSQYLAYWKNMVVDADGNYKLPSYYKKDIYLFAFDIISNDNPTFVGKMEGAWPMTVGGYSYSNAGSDKIVITCEFSVDKGIPFASGVTGSNNISSIEDVTRDFMNNANSLAGNIANSVNPLFNTFRSVFGGF